MFNGKIKSVLLVAYLLACVFHKMPALAQYETPKDPRYWRYHSWYKNHSVLHLVVSGKDRGHLLEVLKTLEKLKKQGVAIGEVMVIGAPTPALRTERSETSLETQISDISSRLGLGESSMESSVDVVRRFGISSSPTWVVRFRGKNYVFEGVKSPSKLFTSGGVFRGAD